MTDNQFNRRDFIKLAAVGAAAAAGTKAVSHAGAAGAVPHGDHQWVMVIDQSKCTGCEYCTLACSAHNDVAPDMAWNEVVESGTVAEHITYIPRPCMHCEEAPCVEVCPVKASYYRDDGLVMMDYDRCIGCRYCQVACPYDARKFNWKAYTGANPAVPEWGQPEIARRPRGVPEKCSFCVQRIDRGLELGLTPGVDPDATPACCVVCPTGARMFGDLNDPNSQVSRILREHASFRLRENLGTSPRVFYLPADPVEME